MNTHLNLSDELREWDRLEAERLAALNADYASERNERAELGWVEPQGRREQGWPARRCSPEMAVYDPTEDDERRAPMSAAEAFLMVAIYCISAVFVTWLLVVVSKAWS